MDIRALVRHIRAPYSRALSLFPIQTRSSLMSVPSFLKPIGCLLAAFVLFAACDSPMPKETQPARSAGPIQAIINGQPSTAPEHAAVLQLLWYGEDICTATLIADLLVLTAAHCVYTNCDWSGESCELDDNPAHYSFRSVPSGQTRKVTAVHAHQNYDDEALTNDIALLELERAFDGVTPIPPLPGDAGRALTQADEGQSITYVGFGLTNPNNPYSSGTRMQTELEIWEVCPGPGTCFGSIPPRTFCSD
ncbi:MAG: trypsin-like serine protease, partial [Myxococcales bacterium]|nr:trypsin-like serine protease [Myxococcales bacterium]